MSPGNEDAASPPRERRHPRWLAVGAGLAAAGAFLLLGSPHLEGQGLYYDEANEVPAAFFQLGAPRESRFIAAAWGQVPLLISAYVSAMKPSLYALWLYLSASTFTVHSWRSLALAIVAIGIFAFSVAAAQRLSIIGLLVFFALWLTDGSNLLLTRLDLSPVSLSTAFRLVWLGVWLRMGSAGSCLAGDAFLFGVFPGLSIFERLNNVVLLGPMIPMFLVACQTTFWRRVIPAVLGFLVGLAPLIAVNIIAGGISLHSSMTQAPLTLDLVRAKMPLFLFKFLAMGEGAEARRYYLGTASAPAAPILECALIILTLGGCTWRAARLWRTDDRARLTGVCVLCYLAIIFLTFFVLPTGRAATGWELGTWIHHWIAATPFQYAAAALTAVAIGEQRRRAPTAAPPGSRLSGADRLAMGSIAVWIAFRLFTIGAIENDLWNRRASQDWDPSYTTVARFAATHRNDATFIAADWGFATQIYALSNGTLSVPEPFWTWGSGWGPLALARHVAKTPQRPVYVLLRKSELPPLRADATQQIVQTLANLAGGRTLPLEPELQNLRSVEVIKFPPPPAP